MNPNGTRTIFQSSVPPANGSVNNWDQIGRYIGSAVISANGNVVAIVNQQSFSYGGDQLAGTDAINYH